MRKVWLGANTLTYPEGGGHLWAYLNWALGFRAAGCAVVWLEHADPSLPEAELHRLLSSLKQRLQPYGFDRSIALCSETTQDLPDSLGADLIPLSRAKEADLFWNMAYGSWGPNLDRFRRTALLDIDPGLLQVWMAEGVAQIPAHDFYFTIGETVGQPEALFPDVGLRWIYTPPCVALEHWQVTPAPVEGAFTTISHWDVEKEWFTYGNETFRNDKRTGFLPYLEIASRTPAPMELALCLGADRELRLTPHDAQEANFLQERGWRVVHSQAVSATPSSYQEYIRRSRGEFSCAKPAFVRLQTAWVSDRTICYLASGRPAIVEHTGPSRFLPEGNGMFRFRNAAEALHGLEEVMANYTHHSGAARRLAEEHFADGKVIPRVLERALGSD